MILGRQRVMENLHQSNRGVVCSQPLRAGMSYVYIPEKYKRPLFNDGHHIPNKDPARQGESGHFFPLWSCSVTPIQNEIESIAAAVAFSLS